MIKMQGNHSSLNIKYQNNRACNIGQKKLKYHMYNLLYLLDSFNLIQMIVYCMYFVYFFSKWPPIEETIYNLIGIVYIF